MTTFLMKDPCPTSHQLSLFEEMLFHRKLLVLVREKNTNCGKWRHDLSSLVGKCRCWRWHKFENQSFDFRRLQFVVFVQIMSSKATVSLLKCIRIWNVGIPSSFKVWLSSPNFYCHCFVKRALGRGCDSNSEFETERDNPHDHICMYIHGY